MNVDRSYSKTQYLPALAVSPCLASPRPASQLLFCRKAWAQEQMYNRHSRERVHKKLGHRKLARLLHAWWLIHSQNVQQGEEFEVAVCVRQSCLKVWFPVSDKLGKVA
jgi:hypothetical protein